MYVLCKDNLPVSTVAGHEKTTPVKVSIMNHDNHHDQQFYWEMVPVKVGCENKKFTAPASFNNCPVADCPM